MADDAAIQISNVSKSFVLPHDRKSSVKSVFTSLFNLKRTSEMQQALKNINVEIEKGEFFGIVGRNGSGKSTLLKILAGIYQPTKGSVHVDGKLVPFIELGVGFNPELTGRDNVFLNGALLGFSQKEMAAMYDDIVQFAELERFMDQKLKNYSSGMQVRLAFSLATRAKADILLVDEVLAVGDAAFQRKCFEYFKQLKADKKTVVFVTHDMGAVQRYCDRALLIEKSQVVTIGSPVKISNMYNRMFLEEAVEEEKAAPAKKPGTATVSPSGEQRWGDGMARFDTVKAKLIKQDDQEFLKVDADITFFEDIDFPIIGYSVKNYEFTQLVGTNTVRKNIKLAPRKKGDKIHISWQTPNIFNEGVHYVDCTIAHDAATSVSDRWPDAVSFRAVRVEDNPYLVYVSEDTEFNISIKKGKG